MQVFIFCLIFLGEIEELLADPIEPSNFIPLSDSICWAIHELTGAGKQTKNKKFTKNDKKDKIVLLK